MILSFTGLVLAYLLIAFLLLMAVLRSDLGHGSKLVLIMAAGGFYWIHFQSLMDSRGWPVESWPPARFEMVSVVVDEPDRRLNSEGSIYLWLKDLDSADSPPRAFRIPYKKDLHLQIDEVVQKQKQGEQFVGTSSARAESSGGSRIEFKLPGKNQNYLKPENGD